MKDLDWLGQRNVDRKGTCCVRVRVRVGDRDWFWGHNPNPILASKDR